MKKLVTGNQSEIHLDKIKENNVILVLKKGKTIGAILHDSSYKWFCSLIGDYNMQDDSLSDLLAYDKLEDCEFHVLD